ncbi:MAG: hypothetical protein ACRCTZ_01200 [Sarcina sp.]
MQYKVTGDMHLWAWVDLLEEIQGKLIKYNCDGQKIYWELIEVAGAIENIDEIENKYNVKFEEVV